MPGSGTAILCIFMCRSSLKEIHKHYVYDKMSSKGNRKKSSSISGQSIKALSPPPLSLELSGHRNFFTSLKLFNKQSLATSGGTFFCGFPNKHAFWLVEESFLEPLGPMDSDSGEDTDEQEDDDDDTSENYILN